MCGPTTYVHSSAVTIYTLLRVRGSLTTPKIFTLVDYYGKYLSKQDKKQESHNTERYFLYNRSSVLVAGKSKFLHYNTLVA